MHQGEHHKSATRSTASFRRATDLIFSEAPQIAKAGLDGENKSAFEEVCHLDASRIPMPELLQEARDKSSAGLPLRSRANAFAVLKRSTGDLTSRAILQLTLSTRIMNGGRVEFAKGDGAESKHTVKAFQPPRSNRLPNESTLDRSPLLIEPDYW